MGLKEYFESEERTKRELAEQRHRFFAQHPELVGMGRNPLEPKEETKGVETVPEIHYVPVEPRAHMTRIKKLEDRFLGLENALIRLSQRKEVPPLKKPYKYLYSNNNKEDTHTQ